MVTTMISVCADREVEIQAQKIFASHGLDMNTAINLFLDQTVLQNDIPFTPSTPVEIIKAKREAMFGCLRGKYDIADDFDEPLDDFKEYNVDYIW